MAVPFLDLKTQYAAIKDEIAQAINTVLDSGQYILGPENAAFEEEFAKAHNAKYCLTVNNGTSAIHLALWALGIGNGDEVLVPVNTFIATAEAVLLAGATPVFVDNDAFFNMDADQLAGAMTEKTKAILPVHLYGQPAQMDRIASFAKEFNLMVVEDAAQAHLAKYQGRSIGSWGAATCFSFYPGKNLGAYGEGGAIITNDESVAYRAKLIRDHGSETKYEHVIAGHNYRLEAMQSAILRVKLRHLPAWTEQRRAIARQYSEAFASIPQLSAPKVREGAEPVWHLYVIETENREALKDHLTAKGIGTGLHYPNPLHRQKALAEYVTNHTYPNAEASARKLLSLPMYPEMTTSQTESVITSVREFFHHN